MVSAAQDQTARVWDATTGRQLASLAHPLMVHGSFENRTERPRRAVVLNVFKDGTRSDSDQPLLAGVPPVAKGELMGGKFFPLLFSPEGI